MTPESGNRHDAVEVVRSVHASARQVFDVLADGWLYPLWVVGASHIRDVDADWPAPGTRIHHGVGPWPMTVHDRTTVLDADPPHMLELCARAWPVGSAWIRVTVRERDHDTTEIVLAERAVTGPGRLLPTGIQRIPLVPRNRESLHRLTDLVLGRRDGV